MALPGEPDPSVGEPQADPNREDPNLRLLREKAAKADDTALALAQAQRENAVLKAGIDTDSPLGDYFVKSYDGDPADVEALKAKATELGVPFKAAPAPPPEEPATPEDPTDPTGTTERTTLADGAPADTGLDEDPRVTAKNHFDKLMAGGAPREKAAGEALNILANAAAKGDKRVIVE